MAWERGKDGPAYFPNILGGLLIVIGAISVIRSFIAHGAPIGTFAFKGLALVSVSVLVFGIVVRGAGLAVAIPILVIISAYASKRSLGPDATHSGGAHDVLLSCVY